MVLSFYAPQKIATVQERVKRAAAKNKEQLLLIENKRRTSWYTASVMGRRRYAGNGAKLSKQELEEFRRSLEKMPHRELETYYKACHNACRYEEMRVPSAQVVQQFVQVWRRLRALKGNGMVWP
jgi:hypothetical protein